MAKFRKKPVVIEAIQYDGSNIEEIKNFMGEKIDLLKAYFDKKDLSIKTLEGSMLASVGDYIIKGVEGEFYPCKPEIFNKTYEKVED